MPAPPHVFALSPGELRYASFAQGEAGFACDTFHAQELPPDTFGSGLLGAPLKDEESFRQLVSRLVRGLPAPVKEASLILPDAWMRLTFADSEELPRQARAREDVLRWKLKRLVPFRVEELRISATELTPFPNQPEPRRLLLGFALEALLTQLEEAFAAAGIELGRITNTTLALLASLEKAVAPGEMLAVAAVHSDAYTLSFLGNGEPLLYRYKLLTEEMAEGVQESSVRRDLRLTRNFIREHFPQIMAYRVFLAAPMALEGQWLDWLQEELEMTPEPLAFEHLHLLRAPPGLSWQESAPLLGAASLEVPWS